MLKEFKTLNEIFNSTLNLEICNAIINIIKTNFGSKEKLLDSEHNMIEENLLKTITVASFLAISNILPIDAVADVLDSTPTHELNINNKHFQAELANINNERLGNYSLTNAINIMSWTLYGEAGN
jgi:hypothetical protein